MGATPGRRANMADALRTGAIDMDAPTLDVGDIEKRLAHLGDPRAGAAVSHYTELYFGAEASGDQQLVILHHIRKTAGTSLRSVMRANHADALCSLVGPLGYDKQMAEHGVGKRVYLTRSRLLELHREIWQRLAPHERRSLRFVASHEANFLYPFLDRHAIVVSLLRQPVERVLSAYHFKSRKASRGIKGLDKIYGDVSEGRPSKKLFLFNGQARSLLEPFYDTRSLQPTAGPSQDADLWRKRLFSLVDEVYLLGISERFDEFVALLAGRLGWQEVFSPRMKVNTERPQREAVAPELLHTIADYNWLDQELYERQLAMCSNK